MLALHYLSSGRGPDESGMYVALGSTEEEVHADAATVGLELTQVAVLDLSGPSGMPPDSDLEAHLSRVDEERTPIVRAILGRARQLEPSRVALDSLTRLRELIPDVEEFRRETLALIRALTELGVTVMSTSESGVATPDDEMQFLVDGVISLEANPRSRAVEITKLRGSNFDRGRHTVELSDDGMSVYPRLVPDAHDREFAHELLSFGIPELNELLHGGLDRGTMTLLSGPSGVGKTTVGMQFMKEAAGRGERSVMFMFDEAPSTLVHRCESVSIPVRQMLERDALSIVPVEPLVRTPDEIASLVRTEVEERGATVVMLDSVSSYQLSVIGGGDSVLERLHALERYLANMGVTGLFVDEVGAVTGDFVASQHGLSYLADTVLFLRYLEVQGALTKAIGVLKKRTGSFENTLRELEITSHGLKVGDPLSHLRGILSSIPEVDRDRNHARP